MKNSFSLLFYIKRIKILVFLLICVLIWIVASHLKHKENTIIYISSQRIEIKVKIVKLYVDGELKGTINLKEYYGLVNWIVIGCYSKEDYSFNKYFTKPLLL